MRLRPLHIGIAAVALATIAVVGLRRGDRDDPASPARARPSAPEPPPAVSAKPAAPQPNHLDRSAAATAPTRPASPPPVSTSPATQASVAEEISIPTELPDSPSLAKKLSRDGALPDYRESYNYQLGLMASYHSCMKGRVAHGVIYYFIRWTVDEDSHVASSPVFESAGVPSEGEVTPDDEAALAACVKDYLAAHDHLVLPHGNSSGESWGMRAVFPLRDSTLLKMIAEARAERGS